MDITTNRKIALLRSSLPDFDYMLPYLTQIEANRCHSNFGPLVREFESRLADFFSVKPSQVVLLANGTLGLQCALMTVKLKKGRYCILPSWTFSATPASAVMAGMEPLFIDVDRETQQITPEIILSLMADNSIDPDEVGAVMAVSPFGKPISRVTWDKFTVQTGIPVVIDAAASFDAAHQFPDLSAGQSPIMVSLHATKLFGIGEGGLIICKDESVIAHIRGLSCFGFDHTRLSSFVGTNAKMSEYQAAIGLGVLDAWPIIREKRHFVIKNYIDAFSEVGINSWLDETYLTSTCNMLTPGQAKEICLYLNDAGIESRVWWGNGCHTHSAYENYRRVGEFNNTIYLSNAMLGLPLSIDTCVDDIIYIREHVVSLSKKTDKQLKAMAFAV